MEVEHPKDTKSRYGGYSYIYFDICEKEFSKSIKIENDFNSERNEMVRSELEDQHFDKGVKTILFAALSVEAAINDYAAWQLGDSYFDAHLSSLDVVSKWVVIPKLVCGKSIDKGGPAFSSLKRLIRTRNELTHNKSRHLDLSDPGLHKKMEKRSLVFDADILNAYKSVVLLSLTMDKLIGSQFNPLRTFNKKVNPLLEVPDNLVDIVNECRNIVGKNHS